MKGQNSYIALPFIILLTGILAGVIAIIFPGQVTNIKPDIEASEFENKAILQANSLLGNHNLIYFDGITYYRGVLEKEKLDAIKLDSSPLALLYPETYTLVNVKETGSENSWTFSIYDKTSENIKKFLECGKDDVIDPIKDCAPKRVSQILGLGFPVSIRYSEDDIRMGVLKLTVVE